MYQRWFVYAATVVALSVSVQVASAQPGRGGPGGFGGGGEMFLLNDENVQKDLEIVDSQKEKLEALQTKIREEMRAMFQGGERPDRDAMREKMEGFQKEMNDILLPHQKDRLKQISVQSRLRFGNTSDAVGDALELTDEQKEDLRKKEREISTEMNKELAKIREKYRDKLLETLTPEQRAKWKQMVGSPIEFGQPQFGRGGQGNRGRGGNNNSN
jgi:Spy/CpxP family protein refolding chaperone